MLGQSDESRYRMAPDRKRIDGYGLQITLILQKNRLSSHRFALISFEAAFGYNLTGAASQP